MTNDDTTETQLSAPLSDDLLADVPTQGSPNHLVVRIAEGMPVGAGEVIAAADDSILTVLVPLGELDYFSLQHLKDATEAHMAGTYRSVTFDLSAASFCDSSIGSFLNWVDDFGGETDVNLITSPAIERVLDHAARDIVETSPAPHDDGPTSGAE